MACRFGVCLFIGSKQIVFYLAERQGPNLSTKTITFVPSESGWHIYFRSQIWSRSYIYFRSLYGPPFFFVLFWRRIKRILSNDEKAMLKKCKACKYVSVNCNNQNMSKLLKLLVIICYLAIQSSGCIFTCRAGQVRMLVRKFANPQLRTNEKSCIHAEFSSFNCGLAVANYF